MYNEEKVIGRICRLYKYNIHFKYNELFQIGYEGYLKALKNSSHSYEDMPMTYAIIYIKSEINRALNEANRYSAMCCDKDVELVDCSDEDELYDAQFLDCVYQMSQQFVGVEAEIFQALYVSGTKTMIQIAKDAGVSRQRVYQIKDTMIARIRRKLNE